MIDFPQMVSVSHRNAQMCVTSYQNLRVFTISHFHYLSMHIEDLRIHPFLYVYSEDHKF